MMVDFKVLVLDDDEGWLARHERRLTQAGIVCRSTQDGAEAIKIAKTDPSVKFALIDEILYTQSLSSPKEEQELQQWQGSGVIRQISMQRSDVQIVVVTAAPKLKSEGNIEAFRRETTKLRRQKGVVDIVHKVDIEEAADDTYGWIVDLLKRPRPPIGATVIKPRVLIGLGFTKEVHEAIAEQIGTRRKQYLPIADVLKLEDLQEDNRSRMLEKFWQQTREQRVVLEMPGSKTLDLLTAIKPTSSDFQILKVLAGKTELNLDVIIRENEYKHTSRKSKKTEVSALPDHDPASVKDYAFGYDENRRKQIKSGVQIEGKLEQNSALKVAISRLRDKLSKLNVGPANQLFIYERDGYRPQFELGIVVYAVKAQRQSTKTA